MKRPWQPETVTEAGVPADMLDLHAESPIPEPPEWHDPLDEAWWQLKAAAREAEAGGR